MIAERGADVQDRSYRLVTNFQKGVWGTGELGYWGFPPLGLFLTMLKIPDKMVAEQNTPEQAAGTLERARSATSHHEQEPAQGHKLHHAYFHLFQRRIRRVFRVEDDGTRTLLRQELFERRFSFERLETPNGVLLRFMLYERYAFWSVFQC